MFVFTGTALAGVSFSTAPALPALTNLTLNGGRQTTTTKMTNFAISYSAPTSGWNLTIAGLSGTGNSSVFKQYCPNTTCGTDSGPGYVSGGFTLAADSLTLNTTGASWTGSGTQPTYQCNSGCFVDSPSAVKVVSASTSSGTGTWTTTGFSTTSLSLSTPSTLRKLQPGEVYRVTVVWTLNTGP